MSGWFTPRNMLYATGILAGVAMVPKLTGPNTNIFETPGSKQIGDRWSAGGATNNHTPGAATPRGDPNKNIEPQINPKGVTTAHYKENVASQRPGDPGPFDKAWNEAHYGQEKGK